MRGRRQDHLQGRRHKDCQSCWKIEDRGQLSQRQLETRPEYLSDSLDPHKPALLEITMGNVCDLACRYCDAEHSTIWSQRLGDDSNSKHGRSSARSDDRYQTVMPEFNAWLQRELDGLHSIWFTGGEVLLMDSFYDLVKIAGFKNKHIGISTNLNANDQYMERILKLVHALVDDGNTVLFRVSMDGVGQKNDWQRQGSNWARMAKNWYTLGAIPGVGMSVGYTVTPLTLEGMLEVGNFVLASAPSMSRMPIYCPINLVRWPADLDPSEWISAFSEDFKTLSALIKDNGFEVTNDGVTKQLDEWSHQPFVLPSAARAGKLVAWLDKSAGQWGGGDWRPIYPRIHELATLALMQAV
jgi:sulfatase maturation enzyme AslB (radical SAM superfamily)